jgi:integrase
VKVLEEAKALMGRGGLGFPGRRAARLGDATLSHLFRRLKIPCVPHGMRSSFRDWCSDTGVPREVAEAALAHVVRNKVEAAYARSDLLDRRREVMQAWSDYLAPDDSHATA